MNRYTVVLDFGPLIETFRRMAVAVEEAVANMARILDNQGLTIEGEYKERPDAYRIGLTAWAETSRISYLRYLRETGYFDRAAPRLEPPSRIGRKPPPRDAKRRKGLRDLYGMLAVLAPLTPPGFFLNSPDTLRAIMADAMGKPETVANEDEGWYRPWEGA